MFISHFRKESKSRWRELTPGAGPATAKGDGKGGDRPKADTGGNHADRQSRAARGSPAPRGWARNAAKPKASSDGGGTSGPERAEQAPRRKQRPDRPAGGPVKRLDRPLAGRAVGLRHRLLAGAEAWSGTVVVYRPAT